jgi:hypothetical protein
MPTNVIDAMAGIIRQVDGDNTLPPTELGEAITAKLPPFFAAKHGYRLVAFIERTNPDKAMGAGALAELIVAEFQLDEVA